MCYFRHFDGFIAKVDEEYATVKETIEKCKSKDRQILSMLIC